VQDVLLALRRGWLSASLFDVLFQGSVNLPLLLEDANHTFHELTAPLRRRVYGMLVEEKGNAEEYVVAERGMTSSSTAAAASSSTSAATPVSVAYTDVLSQVLPTVVAPEVCSIDATFAKATSNEQRIAALFSVLCSQQGTYAADKVSPRLTAAALADLQKQLTTGSPLEQRHWLFVLALLALDQAVAADSARLAASVAQRRAAAARKQKSGKKDEINVLDVARLIGSLKFAMYDQAVSALQLAYVHSQCVPTANAIPRVTHVRSDALAFRGLFTLASELVLTTHALCRCPLGIDLSLAAAVDGDTYFHCLALIKKGPQHVAAALKEWKLTPPAAGAPAAAASAPKSAAELYEALQQAQQGVYAVLGKARLQTPDDIQRSLVEAAKAAASPATPAKGTPAKASKAATPKAATPVRADEDDDDNNDDDEDEEEEDDDQWVTALSKKKK
jgi:hypothetical protein